MLKFKKKIGRFLEKLIILDTRYKMKKLFVKNSGEKLRVLDFGCGERGSLDYNKLEFSINLSGFDSNEDSVKKFSKRYEKIVENFGVIEIGGLKKFGKFDLVVLGGVIQYIDDPFNFLKEIKFSIKEDGFLIISTVNKDSFLRRLNIITKEPKRKAGEFKIYSTKEMEDVLKKSGFEMLSFDSADFFPFPKNLRSNIIFLCKIKS